MVYIFTACTDEPNSQELNNRERLDTIPEHHQHRYRTLPFSHLSPAIPPICLEKHFVDNRVRRIYGGARFLSNNSVGLDDAQRMEQPNAGAVFAIRLEGIKGIPEPYFRG